MAFLDYGCYIWHNGKLVLPHDQYENLKEYVNSLGRKGYTYKEEESDGWLIHGHGFVYNNKYFYSVLKGSFATLTTIDHENRTFESHHMDYYLKHEELDKCLWKKAIKNKTFNFEYENDDIKIMITSDVSPVKDTHNNLCKHVFLDKATGDEWVIIAGYGYGTNAESLDDTEGALSMPDGDPIPSDVEQHIKDYEEFSREFKKCYGLREQKEFLWNIEWPWPSFYFRAEKYAEPDYHLKRQKQMKKAFKLLNGLRPYSKYPYPYLKPKYRKAIK